ncbi:MAG: DUF512 domain-containing protein [Clostridia bacterium]|nr:DUF512 domain-containing protein [Clostridia bacterium]
MSVKIKNVLKGSLAYKAGILPKDILTHIDGNEIMDVLDYSFYEKDAAPTLSIIRQGKPIEISLDKQEGESLGLEFATYLMDEQRSCRNKCIFCFIDQLPKGMRESLYFKDDDSRMSFLFGNYITLTNITDHEVDRIIKMHISPVNISVHTTNPELRCKMMNNRFAGKSLEVLWKLCEAGIEINCQLVMCPGYNDGQELIKTLTDLCKWENIRSIALVPVGLTGHRQGLAELHPFDKKGASEVIETAEEFGNKTLDAFGTRRVFAADEFYLIAEKTIPQPEFYEEFAQLENGVGLWALTKSEAEQELKVSKKFMPFKRKVSAITGEAAYPLIKELVDSTTAKWHNLECNVYAIKNEFFGGHINVTGLVTGTDIINQLSGKDLGDQLIIPDVMLRHENDMFLDSITVEELEKKLGVKVHVISTDGASLVDALVNIKKRK